MPVEAGSGFVRCRVVAASATACLAACVVVCLGSMTLLAAAACSPVRPETRAASVAEAERRCDTARREWYSDRPEAAREEIERALALAPDDADAHRLLGVLFLGRGETLYARQHLERALAIRPDFHAARGDLATALLAEERWEEAATLFAELTETASYENRALAHAGLAWALYNQGRLRDAAHHSKVAIALDPRLCAGYENLGLTYETLGEWSLALDAYEQAVRHCGYPSGGAPPLLGLLEPTR